MRRRKSETATAQYGALKINKITEMIKNIIFAPRI
jgi:hypothetical protein